ncbi:MAG: hypothetical protein DRQ49_18775 [Gammaproteobacteria bacterium]|nr:MAG: hypothetical protein DRQ49_18775 [Gammaproteobacteria bacterium]
MKKLILLIFLISQFSTSVLAGESISEVQAKTIAENFVEIEKQNFPSWNEVSIKNSHAIYSSNGVVVGYEISFHDKKGNDRGYLIVGSDKSETIIPSFSENGSSIYDALVQYYESNLKQRFESLGLIPKETIFLGRIPFHFAVGVKFQEGDHIENNDFISQDGWFIFSPNPDSQKKIYKKSKLTRRSSRKSHEENKEFYDALINGDKNSKFFKKESSGKIGNVRRTREAVSSSINNVTPVEGSKLFSNFTQKMDPNKPWTKGGLINGKCAAGCGPVGWAILLEYWDRNGYPNLVSSITDNANRTATDPDVSWTINELRGYLETTCKDGQGETMPWNIDQGEDYIKSRGYEPNVSTNMDFEPGFWDVIRDINANRPPLVLFDSSKDFTISGSVLGIPNHYVVAYAYDDNFGTANDRFKVKTGWNSLPDYPTDKWFNRDTISHWGAGVTSVEITSPPSLPPNPYFDGTGSLVDPQNNNGCDGCERDYVKLHSHGVLASAGFFQVFKISGVCESIDLTGLNSASIEVRSWSGRGTDSEYYSINGSSTIPLTNTWNLVAFQTNHPIASGSTKTIKATCRSNNSSNVSEVSGIPMMFDGNYHWGGNGSIINHSNNQSHSDTQAGYGRNRDTAVLLGSKKTLSVFQVTNTQSCSKVKFSTPVSFNLSWKLWNEKNWQGSKTINDKDIFTFPTSDYWWILKVEAPAINNSDSRIDVVCES